MSALAAAWRVYSLTMVFAIAPLEASAQCVVVVDDKAEPKVAAPEVDVRQIIHLTKEGRSALENLHLAYAYVEVTRELVVLPDGRSIPSATFVRMLDKEPRGTPFTFSRDGAHTLRVFGSPAYTWPVPPEVGKMAPLCADVPLNVEVSKPRRRPDFPGVRSQWWGAYWLPAQVELGTSVFFKRLGFATSVQLAIPRKIGDPSEPSNVNPVTGAFEVRYRGSRGYLGGGVRYYPDAEADRDHVRVSALAGEELHSFRGRPFWLLVDLSLQDPRPNFIKGLRLTLGVRADLWGSQK